ncbi:DNA translocase FtsK [Thiomicrorhabdus heinhorstiae]|uniref:DNA translocase FtsK n=1 Tax=Thiomicrorhabdus heinhorstiae TaxID=2748010 RepID=A0ABS0BY59_9GAMM|nr:DNA translocase FtsK [Thiomicrorhabdus heinhorstiae]MBF6058344.1 DNA translocase FtsK 4TM domain-containing protein [Thiomicrorhabdus heinhorstiae]
MDTVKQPQTASSLHRFAWILKDGVVLSCIGLAFFLFIVLFSYHPQDPGFDTAGSVHSVANYGGKTGAWIASMILYIFGVFGFLIPFGILLAGWVTLKIRNGNELDYIRFVMSLFGLLVLLSAGAGLANLYMNPDTLLGNLPYSAGGVWGYELSRWLVSSVDLLGTTLILLVLFALAVSMLSSCSWLTIVESTGRITWQVIDWGQARYQSFLNGAPELNNKVNNLKARVQVISAKLKFSRKRVKEESSQEENLRVNKDKGFALDDDLSQSLQVADKHFDFSDQQLNDLGQEKAPKIVSDEKVEIAASPSLSDDVEQIEIAPVTQSLKFDEEEEAKPHASEVKVGKKSVPQTANVKPRIPQLPSIELLDPPPSQAEGFSEEQLKGLSALLEQSLKEFGVTVTVESVQPGPVVTRFEVLPAPGVKVSQINNLAKDLARVLSVKSVRVVDIIPGKAVVGIEIPNETREIVSFREVLSSHEFQAAKSPLSIALGKDISGKPVVADIAKMPHLLVAGTTGAGKSVGVNSMILSLLYKSTPDEVRLIMVDPKMLELSIYEDIPHLLTPVVTDMSDAANALRWCVFEMDRRYQLMAKMGVRNIAGFNMKVQAAIDKGEPIIDPLYQQAASYGHEFAEAPPTLTTLPYIVVVVDEFADMIMVVGKEVEQLIARIAQKARAAGIHLILATQRPSVNVITGLIKANIPTRISFMVNTKIDSRTILDQGGAEQLLGMGDMLFLPPGSGSPRRVHGAFMTDDEVHRVAEFVKSQGEPQYLQSITQSVSEQSGEGAGGSNDAEQDPLYDEIVQFVIEGRRVSTSFIQRNFSIGYNRAARIVEAMEAAGVVSTAGANGNREVLAPKPE